MGGSFPLRDAVLRHCVAKLRQKILAIFPQRLASKGVVWYNFED